MIRVLVVDDNAAFRTGMTRLLATIPDIELCGTAADGSLYYDLNTGQVAYQGAISHKGWGWIPLAQDKPDNFYSPESLAAEGIR